MKFSIKDFLSRCDQILSFLRIWSHLLKKFLMENFIFCAVFMIENNDKGRLLMFLRTVTHDRVNFWPYLVFKFRVRFVVLWVYSRSLIIISTLLLVFLLLSAAFHFRHGTEVYWVTGVFRTLSYIYDKIFYAEIVNK